MMKGVAWMAAAKKAAAKRAAEKDDVDGTPDLSVKEVGALEDVAHGTDVGAVADGVQGGVAVAPVVAPSPSDELREKRARIHAQEPASSALLDKRETIYEGSTFTPLTPITDTHVIDVDVNGVAGDGLTFVAAEGRVRVKGDATFDRDSFSDLVRLVERARQAVA